MNREPLRLGTSTSCLLRFLPEDLSNAVRVNSSFANQESEQIRQIARGHSARIAESGIRSLEYFLTLPMLDLGVEHPMIEMVNELGDQCEVWSVHAPFGGVDLASPEEEIRGHSVHNVKRAAEIASGLNAQILTVHPGLELPDMEPRSARIEAGGRSIAEVADFCAPMGLRVAVEILPRKCIGNSITELFEILSLADRMNVGICLDSNHSFPAGDLPEVVRTLGSKLFTLHISDHDDVDEKHWLPMRGVIDWPVFILSLQQIDYTGPFLYEASLGGSDISEAIATLKLNYKQLIDR